MNKIDFINLVYEEVKVHPDWFKDVLQSIHAGVQARLDEEITKRVEAEYSLVIAYEAGKKKIKPHQLQKVKNAIKNSIAFAGTEYTKKL